LGWDNWACDAHFGKEAFPADRIISQFRWEELQGYRLAKLQIVGSVDLSHAPAPEQTDNTITVGNYSSWGESSSRNGVG
jgi:hypothetical protein